MTENVLRRFARIDKSNITPAIVLAALCLILAVISPTFRTQDNLVNILQQVTINAIIAVGMTLVIFTGGVDLSVGSVLGLSGIVMGIMIVDNKMSPLIAVPVAIALGAACGFVNGILISKLKLQPMIATLAMMSMARGAALTLANGKTITGYSKEFTWIGQGTIPGTGIPVQIVLMLALYVGFYYLMKYRKTGRYIYAIGGNEEATRLSGINVVKYKTLTYTLAGTLAALASFVLVAKLNSAQPIAGQDYELDAIASAVIGGASLLGGSGNMWGTLMGAIIIGVIRNGLNLLNVSSNLQKLILGIIILIAILTDALRNRKRA
ncbi:MAG: ribose ABC transporter permease [Propionibacteriaceae bacterium]|nr:ribose ABC transporter permease [Propionibacteriaceae bacterium]